METASTSAEAEAGEDGPFHGPPEGTDPEFKDSKNRFEIVRKLGSGTYGKVSLAFDHKFQKRVAVKIIKKNAIENAQDLLRIRREIRIMSALHHPNVIQIYEVFENQDKIIIVMEYASGGELYDYVSSHGSLAESEARRLFRQICSAVFYCHQHKVAHRDLKLENILMDKDMGAKIADFGLSNYFGVQGSLLHTFCGSPLYASPEIINGTPYRGPEVDCWSLGVLLYTLVYGSMPFDGRDFNRMIRQIKRGAYYEPDIPSSASMLIRTMLRVNPDRRSDIGDIASHWWLNYDQGQTPIPALPENQVTDPTPLVERKETMVVQDLSNEADVFMEFSHLSNATRKKIEDFRRRRLDAESFVADSPGAKKGKNAPSSKAEPGRRSKQGSKTAVNGHGSLKKDVSKSLKKDASKSKRADSKTRRQDSAEEKAEEDPLERLKALEARLQGFSADRKRESKEDSPTSPTKAAKAAKAAEFTPKAEVPLAPLSPPRARRSKTPKEVDSSRPRGPSPEPLSRTAGGGGPLVMGEGRGGKVATPPRPIAEVSPQPLSPAAKPRAPPSPPAPAPAPSETTKLNNKLNLLMEASEKGSLDTNLIDEIKASPAFETNTFANELLMTVLEFQGNAAAKPKPEAPKIGVPDKYLPYKKTAMQTSTTKEPDVDPMEVTEEVPEVPESEPAVEEPPASAETEEAEEETAIRNMINVPITMMDSVDVEEEVEEAEVVEAEAEEEVAEEEEEEVESTSFDEEEVEMDEFSESGSEVKELGDRLPEENGSGGSFASAKSSPEEEREETSPSKPCPTITMSNANGDAEDPFSRGLSKRQSKGKYERMMLAALRPQSIDEEPILGERPLAAETGGMRPDLVDAPVLFERAKGYLLQYPRTPEASTDREDKIAIQQRRMHWLKTADPDMGSSQEYEDSPLRGGLRDSSVTATFTAVAPLKSKSLEEPDEESEEEEEDEELLHSSTSSSKKTGGRYFRVLWPNQVSLDTDPQGPHSESVPPISTQESIDLSPPSGPAFVLQPPPPPRNATKPEPEASMAPAKAPTTPPPESPKKAAAVPSVPVTPAEKFISSATIQLTPKRDSPSPPPAPERPKDLSPSKHFLFNADTAKSPSPSDTSRERLGAAEGGCLSLEPTPTAVMLRQKTLSKERRRRARTTGFLEEALFRKASELLTRDGPNDAGEKEVDALLSPRAFSTIQPPPPVADAIAPPFAKADTRRSSYRTAITQPISNKDWAAGPLACKAPPKDPPPTDSGLGSSTNSEHLSVEKAVAEKSERDPFYSSSTAQSNSRPSSSLMSYVRPRINLDSYRSSRAAADEAEKRRAKSRSLHELSPGARKDRDPSPRLFVYQPRTNYDRIWSPDRGAREDPVAPPRRRKVKSLYEVLNDSGELATGRDSERGSRGPPAKEMSPDGIARRHTYYGNQDLHPSSAYSSSPTPRAGDQRKGSAGYFESKFDSNVTYRRNLFDTIQGGSERSDPPPSSSRVGRFGGRVSEGWKRSQSLDKTRQRFEPHSHTDGPPSSSSSRPGGYNYVNYHDTLGSGSSGPREPPKENRPPSKGILKRGGLFSTSIEEDNKAYGTAASAVQDYQDAMKSSRKPAGLRFVEKIRRHLSSEKIPDQVSREERPSYSAEHSPYSVLPQPSKEPSPASSSASGQRAKREKRSLLDMARRRTTEINLGDHGSSIRMTGGNHPVYEPRMSSDRRPTSPIEKLKGFFRAKTPTSAASEGGASGSSRTSYASGLSAQTDPTAYSSALYPSPNSSRHASPYKKTLTSSAYGRHIPMTRYWYEDSTLY